MTPVYLDLHIHTSDNPTQLNPNYNLRLLIKKINEVSGNAAFMISLTDHNTMNKKAYLEAVKKSIYYNQFDGFTARGDSKLEKTQEYFKRLGINEFVHLVTCSDNYDPSKYPNGKDQNPFKPTWMMARPTFNGLRLSLSEKSRLVYSYERPQIWSENIRSVKLNKPSIEIDVE